MNKLMMTVGSLAMMAIASPALAQSSAAPTPGATAPNNSSTNMPMDMAPHAPMSSQGSTSAVSPMQGHDGAAHRSMHNRHHNEMGPTRASGSKSTDNDAEQLNQQELGKLQAPN